LWLAKGAGGNRRLALARYLHSIKTATVFKTIAMMSGQRTQIESGKGWRLSQSCEVPSQHEEII